MRGATPGKIAQITLLFWLTKICATTLGETAGDLLSMTLGLGYAASSLLLLFLLAIALGLQLRATRFIAPVYWAVILATSMAGTTMSDYMDRTLGVGYASGSAILATLLVIILLIWRTVEGTLSVNEVRSRRAELFYWTAILVSNTLGTALGDYLADDSGLGFLGGAALIAGLLVVIVLCYRLTALSRVALFWTAFVLTRPFGATFGDLLTKTPAQGGLGFGTIGASLVLAILLAGLVGYAMRTPREIAER
jgi:uncharacterized membrane-anchored protein